MSRVIKEGAVTHCESVMSNLLKVLGLLVEDSKEIAEPKDYLEAYL